jgi:hypothetical protein
MAKDIRQAAREQAERIARQAASGSLGRVTGMNYRTRFSAEELMEVERKRRELAERLRDAETPRPRAVNS